MKILKDAFSHLEEWDKDYSIYHPFNEFWELIKAGKCINRGNTEVEHINQTDWNGFGRQLSGILKSNQYLENSRKNALKNIEALDTSKEEKEALVNQIEELYASVEPFIKKGEE